MKVVFLDFTGVLFTFRSQTESRRGMRDMADDKCVKQLNRLIDETHAVIVVSSDYRHSFSLRELNGLLKDWGVKKPAINALPWGLGDKTVSVKEWIERNSMSNIEKFVILDDELEEPKFFHENIVQTRYRKGLTKELANKAISLLL